MYIMPPLESQEAALVLAASLHACNRSLGSEATRVYLRDLLGDHALLEDHRIAPILSRTTSTPVHRVVSELVDNDDESPLQTAPSAPLPVYRGRWADLDSEED